MTDTLSRPRKPRPTDRQTMRVDDLLGMAAPYNPRTIDDKALGGLTASVKRFGLVEPVVWNRRTQHVVGGHQRLRAAKAAGIEETEVVIVDLPLAEEKALNIALNNPEIQGQWSDGLEALLAEVRGESPDLYAELLLAELAAENGLAEASGEPADAEPQIDRAAELQAEWKTERGQLWEIPGAAGTHRVLCGDCREAADVDRVLAGDRVNVCMTSPPYASQRKYDEASGFKPIRPDEYVAWWEAVQANVRRTLAADGSFFVNIKPNAEGLDRELYVFDLVVAHVRKWGWHFAEEFCWERVGIPQQVVRRFKNQFEPVYQFTIGEWKIRPDVVTHAADRVPKPMGKGKAGDTNAAKRQGVCSAVAKNEVVPGVAYPGNRLPSGCSEKSLGHGAVFPPCLPSFFYRAFSDSGDIVFEPFAGSGSCIVAAENTGRVSRSIELSPKYVAVILQRLKDIGLSPRLAT